MRGEGEEEEGKPEGVESRNPKPRTRNPKPETRNPKPETRNPKPDTRNPKPDTRNPKPETLKGWSMPFFGKKPASDLEAGEDKGASLNSIVFKKTPAKKTGCTLPNQPCTKKLHH